MLWSAVDWQRVVVPSRNVVFLLRLLFPHVFLDPSAASPVPSHSLVIHFSHACQSLVLSLAGVIIVGGTLKRDSPLAPNGVLSYLPCTLVLWILFLLFSFVLCSAFLSPDLECAFPILSYVLRREKYRLVSMLIYSYLKLIRLVGGGNKRFLVARHFRFMCCVMAFLQHS